ncbi:hypothetical protein CG51_06025 [Haematobacter missouriensis]|nr:hypothetical protein CG51_06025 [Haematobacter missouriensis]
MLPRVSFFLIDAMRFTRPEVTKPPFAMKARRFLSTIIGSAWAMRQLCAIRNASKTSSLVWLPSGKSSESIFPALLICPNE